MVEQYIPYLSTIRITDETVMLSVLLEQTYHGISLKFGWAMYINPINQDS